MVRVTAFLVVLLAAHDVLAQPAGEAARSSTPDSNRTLSARPAVEAVQQRMTPEVARALLEEAGSVRRLSAEGKLLHEGARRQLSWGQYCGNAMLLNDQGEFRRAIQNASQALFIGERDRDPNATAFAKRDLAVSFLYSGNLEIAERYARESVAIPLTNANNNWNVRSVSFKTLGDVAARRGDWAAAMKHYEEASGNSSGAWKRLVQASIANALLGAGEIARAKSLVDDLLSGAESPVREVLLRVRGNLAVREGRATDALGAFRELGAIADDKDGVWHRVWALEGEARAHRLLGDKAATSRALLAAVEAAEQVRARFRSEEFKAGTFGEMQSVFDAAVAALAADGQAERALAVSESGRARALLDLMRDRVKQGDGKTTLADALGIPVSPSDLRKHLGPSDAVVQYHVTREATYAWIIRADGITLHTLPTGRDSVRAMVHDVRRALSERNAAVAGKTQAVHRALLAPLSLPPGSSLVIVPHDALHLVPFQALHDGSRYLVETNPVSYAPSSSVLVRILLRQSASRVPRLLALGNPDLGDPALSLPGAEREVKQIQSSFADHSVFIGREASKARFLSEAPGYSLVHVAAHAEFDSVDPLHSRVLLAGSGATGGNLHAFEVYRLDLAGTSLLTLSACESGLARVTSGDEIWGFSRSFLSAGASALLLSLWPVADESTDLLMTGFYKALRASGARDALRASQLALLRDPKFAHPYFWSPFNLTGNWK